MASKTRNKRTVVLPIAHPAFEQLIRYSPQASAYICRECSKGSSHPDTFKTKAAANNHCHSVHKIVPTVIDGEYLDEPSRGPASLFALLSAIRLDRQNVSQFRSRQHLDNDNVDDVLIHGQCVLKHLNAIRQSAAVQDLGPMMTMLECCMMQIDQVLETVSRRASIPYESQFQWQRGQ